MDFIQFAVERYNYWIVIILMMTGLYTVIARGNLVKKIIGLNIFQTSVFIYYISMGKIAGGTAPIYVPGDMEARTDHGDGHGGGEHGSGGDHEASHDVKIDNHAVADGEDSSALHAAPHGSVDATTNDFERFAQSDPANAMGPETIETTLHTAGGAANDHLAESSGGIAFTVTESADTAAHAAGQTLDVIYSNPLPHVLILTAIVVGVATTAVGLALAVRIREAYGTIEEDELEAADNIAEFGVVDPKAAEARA